MSWPLFRWLCEVWARKESALPARHRRGREGEARAERWLRRELGWTCLARNWRAGRGELDRIMRTPEGVLVFVEVRGRAAHALVSGYQSITPHKRRVLRRTIEAYLRRLGKTGRPPWRCDVVELRWRAGAEPEIRHFVNVRL